MIYKKRIKIIKSLIELLDFEWTGESIKHNGKKERIMKRKTILILIAVFMIMVSCSTSQETKVTEAPTEAPTEVVTSEPTKVPTLEPTPDTNGPMYMASTILYDPQVINGEDTVSMTENTGGMFAFTEVKKPSDDGSYYIFGSGGDGSWFRRNEGLNYGNRHNCQGIMIKFMPNDTDILQFVLMGDNEMYLKFEDGQPYYVNFNNFYQAPYSQYRETNFTLQSDKWYWAIMAVDGEGAYRSVVWEDGNSENNAYCEDHTGVEGGDWNFIMSFGPNQTLFVEEYKIVDFDGFTDMSMSNDDHEGGDSQGDNQQSNPMGIVEAILVEPQVLYQDDLSSLPENGYNNYSDVDEKNPGDGFEFITRDSSNGFTFLTPLLDVVPAGERKDNYSQAVLINFKTNNPTGLQLNLVGQERPFVTFMNGGEPAYGIIERPEFGMTLFRDAGSNEFVLQPDTWYYALMAININGDVRFKIWQEGNPDDNTHIAFHLVEEMVGMENRNVFAEKNWIFEVWIGNNSQLNMKEFKVMDFADYK